MDEFKKEEKQIAELKKVERRINYFNHDFNDNRNRSEIDRDTKCANIKYDRSKIRDKK